MTDELYGELSIISTKGNEDFASRSTINQTVRSEERRSRAEGKGGGGT